LSPLEVTFAGGSYLISPNLTSSGFSKNSCNENSLATFPRAYIYHSGAHGKNFT
jgi:hypothetical protein